MANRAEKFGITPEKSQEALAKNTEGVKPLFTIGRVVAMPGAPNLLLEP
jgi:hypothetical protein